MNRPIPAALVLGLMLVTGSLAGQNVPEPTRSKALPDVTLPPELDRVLRDYERAWRAGDAVALASLFVEDGFALQNNSPPIRGRPDIQAAYESQAGGPLRLRALAFANGDTIGYIIGAYGYGDPSGDTGKFTLTLRRTPGEPWLIVSDMDNQNASSQHLRVPGTPSPTNPPAAGHQNAVQPFLHQSMPLCRTRHLSTRHSI